MYFYTITCRNHSNSIENCHFCYRHTCSSIPIPLQILNHFHNFIIMTNSISMSVFHLHFPFQEQLFIQQTKSSTSLVDPTYYSPIHANACHFYLFFVYIYLTSQMKTKRSTPLLSSCSSSITWRHPRTPW